MYWCYECQHGGSNYWRPHAGMGAPPMLILNTSNIHALWRITDLVRYPRNILKVVYFKFQVTAPIEQISTSLQLSSCIASQGLLSVFCRTVYCSGGERDIGCSRLFSCKMLWQWDVCTEYKTLALFIWNSWNESLNKMCFNENHFLSTSRALFCLEKVKE